MKKRQLRLAGVDDKILALYAKVMNTRDIESALVDMYGVTISHTLIVQVTDSVLGEARAWQPRPLEVVYPIDWLDGIVVKVQLYMQVINKSAYVGAPSGGRGADNYGDSGGLQSCFTFMG